MSDDEDYMSDKFLFGTEKSERPSLLYKQSQKREMEMMKKKAEAEARMKDKNKSVKVMEQEKREEGLSLAISSSNKGFEMLMRMGYKPGQGIGKSESGRSEPIPMDLKTNRLGLGKADKKKLPSKKINTTEKLESMNSDDFRARMAAKKLDQLIEVDLYKSQKVCEQLDSTKNIKEPRELWFWLPVKKEKNSDDEEETEIENEEEQSEEDEFSTTEKLEILTKYLRDKYFYCIWCGATYDSDEDLKDNCPGSTRNDH